MKHRALYVLFFCSGISGLIYQVVWVRQFANVFGNTVYSAAAVTAVFMSGLGFGGLAAGRWADRLHARRTGAPLEMYGKFELAIAGLAGALALALPRLEAVSAAISSYSVGEHGWLEVSLGSMIARFAVAIVLLAPVCALMGGTLTLLIRYVVGSEIDKAGSRVAVLYAVNTAGAALGCLLTDLVLIPLGGLLAAQGVAVLLNLVAALGAGRLAQRTPEAAQKDSVAGEQPREERGGLRPIAAVSAALVLTGFVGMGFEIVWFRHLMAILGPFRYVFSLMLAVVLVSMWGGSVLSGWAARRLGRPALLLAISQVGLVVAALGALGMLDVTAVADSITNVRASGGEHAGLSQSLAAYWAVLRPVLICCALPALMMGAAFPLANAHAQRVSSTVGARAGLLYLANTLGAVAGSLVCGLVLLPAIGTQRTVFVIAACAVASLLPLALSLSGQAARGALRERGGLFVCALVGVAALVLWARAPRDWLLQQVVPVGPESTRLSMSEGIGETIGVIQQPKQRLLMTNGHPMSGTAMVNQRYMRLFVHTPLLLIDDPRDVAVICFGVGNTLSAVAVHDAIERIDLIDVSKHVLAQADYFRATNGGVLEYSKVHVHINDGRQHLRMRPPASYDLITLEPPPPAHAGVAALYSTEFYELARSRLRPGGMVSQWLSLDQVTADVGGSIVRAFVEVFPTSVLLAGSPPEFILLGVNGDAFHVDPLRIQARIDANPFLKQELRSIFVDDVTDLLGTYAASGKTLLKVTDGFEPVTDDRPIMEYMSPLASHAPGDPLAIFNVDDAPTWCPSCFDGSLPPGTVDNLAGYLEVMGRLYASGAFWGHHSDLTVGPKGAAAIRSSRYLTVHLRGGAVE